MNSSAKYLACVVIALPACSRIQDFPYALQRKWYLHREETFRADMDRIEKDTQHAYRLDYTLSDEWLPALLSTKADFRAIEDGQFDMSPWLQKNGIERLGISRAVFDPYKRTVTIIDSGPNVALVERIIEPLRPSRYTRMRSLP